MAQAKNSTHLYVVPKPSAVISLTGAGNGETLPTDGYDTVFYDPAGSRTGVILQAGVEAGQKVWIVNTADANETITFAAAGTSKVANGTSCVIEQNAVAPFVWDATTSLWYSAPAA